MDMNKPLQKIGRSLSAGLMVGTALFLTASCSEDWDDPKYQSRSPMFSALMLENLDETADGTFRTGAPIVATAVQSRTGSLLYKADYTWTSSAQDATHKFRNSVVYDYENGNPTDTVTFATPGTYTLTLKARYHVSGNAEVLSGSLENPDGSRVSYSTPSWMYYDVTVERRNVVVKPQEETAEP